MTTTIPRPCPASHSARPAAHATSSEPWRRSSCIGVTKPRSIWRRGKAGPSESANSQCVAGYWSNAPDASRPPAGGRRTRRPDGYASLKKPAYVSRRIGGRGGGRRGGRHYSPRTRIGLERVSRSGGNPGVYAEQEQEQAEGRIGNGARRGCSRGGRVTPPRAHERPAIRARADREDGRQSPRRKAGTPTPGRAGRKTLGVFGRTHGGMVTPPRCRPVRAPAPQGRPEFRTEPQGGGGGEGGGGGGGGGGEGGRGRRREGRGGGFARGGAGTSRRCCTPNGEKDLAHTPQPSSRRATSQDLRR